MDQEEDARARMWADLGIERLEELPMEDAGYHGAMPNTDVDLSKYQEKTALGDLWKRHSQVEAENSTEVVADIAGGNLHRLRRTQQGNDHGMQGGHNRFVRPLQPVYDLAAAFEQRRRAMQESQSAKVSRFGAVLPPGASEVKVYHSNTKDPEPPAGRGRPGPPAASEQSRPQPPAAQPKPAPKVASQMSSLRNPPDLQSPQMRAFCEAVRQNAPAQPPVAATSLEFVDKFTARVFVTKSTETVTGDLIVALSSNAQYWIVIKVADRPRDKWLLSQFFIAGYTSDEMFAGVLVNPMSVNRGKLTLRFSQPSDLKAFLALVRSVKPENILKDEDQTSSPVAADPLKNALSEDHGDWSMPPKQPPLPSGDDQFWMDCEGAFDMANSRGTTDVISLAMRPRDPSRMTTASKSLAMLYEEILRDLDIQNVELEKPQAFDLITAVVLEEEMLNEFTNDEKVEIFLAVFRSLFPDGHSVTLEAEPSSLADSRRLHSQDAKRVISENDSSDAAKDINFTHAAKYGLCRAPAVSSSPSAESVDVQATRKPQSGHVATLSNPKLRAEPDTSKQAASPVLQPNQTQVQGKTTPAMQPEPAGEQDSLNLLLDLREVPTAHSDYADTSKSAFSFAFGGKHNAVSHVADFIGFDTPLPEKNTAVLGDIKPTESRAPASASENPKKEDARNPGSDTISPIIGKPYQSASGITDTSQPARIKSPALPQGTLPVGLSQSRFNPAAAEFRAKARWETTSSPLSTEPGLQASVSEIPYNTRIQIPTKSPFSGTELKRSDSPAPSALSSQLGANNEAYSEKKDHTSFGLAASRWNSALGSKK